jgi:peptidyl-prolyl cis-trans isomerase C
MRPSQGFGLTKFLCLGAVLLALSACGPGKIDDKPPERGDVAAARVGNQTIWASDVKREAISQGLIGQGEPLDISSDLFRRVLDEVIDQKLLAAEARKRKLDTSPLAQRRLAAAQERVLGDLLVEQSVEKAVNESAIRSLYQDQLKQARQSEEFRARQIVVASQAEAESVRKLLAAGASFEALAMERSIDSATRFNGGDLGYFTADVMPEVYITALKSATSGAVVGPIKTDTGYAVLKVEDRRPEEPITLEAARPQIVRFLTYDQVRELLERLRKSAKIQTLIGPPLDVPGAPSEPASAPPEAPATAPETAPVPAPAPAAKPGKPS